MAFDPNFEPFFAIFVLLIFIAIRAQIIFLPDSESLIEKRKILKTIIDLDQKRHQNSSTFYQPTEDKSLARLDGNLQFMHDISYYRKKNKKSNKKSLGKSRDGSKYHRSTTDDSTMSSCSAIEVIDLEASNDVEFEFLE